jgi:subtilisin family serine protease
VRRSTPPIEHAVDPAVLRSSPARIAALDHGRLEDELRQIGVAALHDSGYTGAGILVCFLDAGYNRHDTHVALRDRVPLPGHRRDFVEGDTTVTDTTAFLRFEHGTWVLGCLAGLHAGEYVGAAFAADIALARTENEYSETPAEMLHWAQGAEWADSLGADVISSSVGYYVFDDSEDDYTYADMDGRTTDISRAAQIAASRGILVVNSVGNEGTSPWRYLIAPADVHGDSLIAVGSVDDDGVPAANSSYGPSADGRVKPDLAARGVSVPIVSTGSNPTAYGSASGTSLAAPLIAGLAACLLQARPAWGPQEVIRALRESASRHTNPNDRIGYGIPNGLKALAWPDIEPEVPTSGSLGIRLLGPNPFRPAQEQLEIGFARAATASSASIRVRAYDSTGRLVRHLWSGTLASGERESVVWDGADDDGRALHPGIYWVAVTAGDDVATTRVVVLQ